MQYIVLIGAFQALLAIWLIQFKQRKSVSNYLFSCLLSAIALHLAIKFFIFNFIPDDSIKQQMNTFVGACYGPLIYLYTLTKTKTEVSIAKKWFIFLPLFGLMVMYLTISCVFYLLNHVDHYLLDFYNQLSLYVIFLVNLYYPVKSLFLIKQSETIEKSEYDIIKRISYCLLVMEVVVIISKVLFVLFPEQNSVFSFAIRIIAYVLLVFISFLIIRKSLLAEANPNVSKKNQINFNETNKEEKGEATLLNTIDYEAKFTNIWLKMDQLVRQKELFRDCDLSLDLLASKTEINKYQISEMLNNYKNKPFYRYINEYRIDYFRNMVEKAIEKNENINFLSFAFESGFKSKSSFNRYFKEIIGQTPSEYYKNLMNSQKEQNFEISA